MKEFPVATAAREAGRIGSSVPPLGPLPPGNLEPGTLEFFLCEDFQAAWNGIAANQRGTGIGGNFMFGGLAMIYLELSCRAAKDDSSGRTLNEYARALHQRDPRYFAELPCRVQTPTFDLPTWGGVPADRLLLALLFDLLRNGQAHQYQQMALGLDDGRHVTIALAGATSDRSIDETRAGERPAAHLTLDETSEPIRWLVYPDLLFLDFRRAARAAGVFSQGLRPRYLRRNLPLSTAQLRAALAGPLAS